MAPSFSNNYPITKALYTSVEKKKDVLPMLGPPTTLAKLNEIKIDNYLKKVTHHLKETFGEILKLRGSFNILFIITVLQDNEIVREVSWQITAQQMMRRQNRTIFEVLEMLNDSLFQSHSLLKNFTQISESEIKNLTKFKEHLLQLTKFLDQILMLYSAGSSTNGPDVKEIKRVAKKIRKYIMQLKPETLCKVMPNLLVKEENILCSVLGLEDELAERLANLPSKIRGHQSDKYFILSFLEEDSDFTGNLREAQTVANKLQEMGFTESRSSIVAEWIAKQPYPDHQPLYSWVQDYVEKLFTYDIFLNDKVSNYPYKEKKVDEWFPVSVDCPQPDDDKDTGTVTSDAQVFNTTQEKLEKVIQEKQYHFQQQHPLKSLYFHGTDHAGAQSILEDGINLGAGKRHCDFSRGCGFYLSTSSKFAIDWSKKHEASAIVMFSIEEDGLSKYQSLDLTSDESATDEEKLKKHCRGNGRLPKSLRSKYQSCDYVKGPTVESSHQICIREESMANEIGDVPNIYGIVFVSSNKVLW